MKVRVTELADAALGQSPLLSAKRRSVSRVLGICAVTVTVTPSSGFAPSTTLYTAPTVLPSATRSADVETDTAADVSATVTVTGPRRDATSLRKSLSSSG